jgi:hypothetical protein
MKGRWDFGKQRAGAARYEAAINASQKRSAASRTSRKIAPKPRCRTYERRQQRQHEETAGLFFGLGAGV